MISWIEDSKGTLKHVMRSKWKEYGCTVCCVDEWKDGTNFGGQDVCNTFLLSDDEMPTHEHMLLAQHIVDLHNASRELLRNEINRATRK